MVRSIPDPMARGLFIAFEGGEGVGKTTQICRLAAYLAARKLDVVLTREPGGTPSGQELRKLLLTGEPGNWDPMAETLLMVADRVQHVGQVIRPALEAGRPVISDRYVFSTLAYQGAARGVPLRFLRLLHEQACGDLWPDLTIVLDVDPAIGLLRSERRLKQAASRESRFEKFGPAFHEKVRDAFRDLASAKLAPAILIDASRDIDKVWAEIEAHIAPLFDRTG